MEYFKSKSLFLFYSWPVGFLLEVFASSIKEEKTTRMRELMIEIQSEKWKEIGRVEQNA